MWAGEAHEKEFVIFREKPKKKTAFPHGHRPAHDIVEPGWPLPDCCAAQVAGEGQEESPVSVG